MLYLPTNLGQHATHFWCELKITQMQDAVLQIEANGPVTLRINYLNANLQSCYLREHNLGDASYSYSF